MGRSAIWPRLENARRPEEVLRLGDKIFIDECLSAALVSVAKDRGIDAAYGPHVGKGGWQDRNIARFALELPRVGLPCGGEPIPTSSPVSSAAERGAADRWWLLATTARSLQYR